MLQELSTGMSYDDIQLEEDLEIKKLHNCHQQQTDTGAIKIIRKKKKEFY